MSYLPGSLQHRLATLRDLQEPVYRFLSQRRVMIGLTVLPALLLFVFINVFPIGWAIAAGFYEIPLTAPEWTFTGLENYMTLVSDPAFWSSLWLSVIFAGGSVAVQVVAGTALALVLAKEFKYAKVVRAIALLPYLVPTVVFGYLALFMADSNWGIINWILVDLGILDQTIAWFSQEQYAMISAILTNSWKYSVFVTIMVLARIQSIPQGYYEAAEMAGAGAWRKFRDITLPNLKGVLFIVLLLRGVWMFVKFDILWVLTQGGPNDATRTASIYAYELGFQQYSLGHAAAMSTILFGLLAVCAMIYFYVLEPEQEVRVE